MEKGKGDMICSCCNGRSWIEEKIKNIEFIRYCRKCNGYGKVDWVDNLVRKDFYSIEFMKKNIFIIKNISKHNIIFANVNLLPNQYVYRVYIFDEIELCKHIKDRKLKAYECHIFAEYNYKYRNFIKKIQHQRMGNIIDE